MISSLKGIIQEVLEHSLIVDVNGIGYEVMAVPSMLARLRQGDDIILFTHLQVREDAHTLYGFSSLEERDFFRKLISVNGIGPKTGLAALGAAPIPQLIQAIRLEDHDIFKAVPGLGPKTAKRLVMELKTFAEDSPISSAGISDAPLSVRSDLFAALEGLGYARQEIQGMITQELEQLTVEEALKEILKKNA